MIVPEPETAPAAMFKQNARAAWTALVSSSVSVTVLPTKSPEDNVVIPTRACSMAVPMLVLVVDPHKPDCSPVVISSNLRLEYVLDITGS